MGIIKGLLKKNVADIKNEKLEIVKVMNKNKIIYEKKKLIIYSKTLTSYADGAKVNTNPYFDKRYLTNSDYELEIDSIPSDLNIETSVNTTTKDFNIQRSTTKAGTYKLECYFVNKTTKKREIKVIYTFIFNTVTIQTFTGISSNYYQRVSGATNLNTGYTPHSMYSGRWGEEVAESTKTSRSSTGALWFTGSDITLKAGKSYKL